MKIFLLIAVGFNLLAALSIANPKETDRLVNIPANSSIVFTKKLDIRPNSETLFSGGDACWLAFDLSESSRHILPKTEYKISEIKDSTKFVSYNINYSEMLYLSEKLYLSEHYEIKLKTTTSPLSIFCKTFKQENGLQMTIKELRTELELFGLKLNFAPSKPF